MGHDKNAVRCLGGVAGLCLSLAAGADAGFVAGLRPFERPAGAPWVVRFDPSPAWRDGLLKGIEEPRRGLAFLSDQGAWYTPFNRPNQAGRYDIRGLYPGENKKE